MGVTKKVIFCEGKHSSLDVALLKKLKVTPELLIVPAGSKFTFSVFAQGYFSPDEVTSQSYLVFRDRDFDLTPTAIPTHLESKPNHFMTYRACIENYLLDADLIHTYWIAKFKEKKEYPSSKWGHDDSPGVVILSSWIEKGAKAIQYYQAVRWALSHFQARIHIKTTWKSGSGYLPNSLELDECQKKAESLIGEYKSKTNQITIAKFRERLAHYNEKFEQDEFWTQKQYLVWFHGKDIQKAMQIEKPHYISLKTCFESILSMDLFDINKHPDLDELKEKICHFNQVTK